MKGKLIERFQNTSLYDIVATNRITGLTETLDTSLTYEQVRNINPGYYEKLYKRFRDIRAKAIAGSRIEYKEPETPKKNKPAKGKVVESVPRTTVKGDCLVCKYEFKGNNVRQQIRRHVKETGHQVAYCEQIKKKFSIKMP